VMDYPAPLVAIKDGRIDLSGAYGVGTGAYDDWAITYGYGQFAPGADEAATLSQLVETGVAKGFWFVSDDDARPAGSMHVRGSLWDNGSDPTAMLRQQLEVRRIALEQLSAESVPTGQPLSQLEARLLPIYLHHRYQLQAAAKVIGGARFTYAMKTASGISPAEAFAIASPAEQRAALDAVLDTIAPSFLRLSPRLLALLPPRAYGYDVGTAEIFERRTSPAFDQIGVATVAADLAVSALLNPQRTARLVDFHARNPQNPDLGEVLQALVRRAFPAATASDDGIALAIGRAVQSLVVSRLMELSANNSAAYEVRAAARAALRHASRALADATDSTAVALREDIARHLAAPDEPTRRTPTLTQPQGEPIGNDE